MEPLGNGFPMALVNALNLIIVGVVPDILVVGKPFGNGFPMAMVDFNKIYYCRCSTRYFGGREADW